MILRHRFTPLTRKNLTILGLILVLYVFLGAVLYTAINLTRDDYCEAQITVYEDNSWGAGTLTLNGKVLDKRWDQHMPLWGYPPKVGNTSCTPVLVNHWSRS